MEELKLLIQMVADLPSMALWVILGFFVYKVIIVGSIYGLIKFCVSKVKDISLKLSDNSIKKLVESKLTETVDVKIGSMCISGRSGSYPLVLECLNRVVYHKNKGQSDYLHRDSAIWLKEAIDDKIEKDLEAKRRRNQIMSVDVKVD